MLVSMNTSVCVCVCVCVCVWGMAVTIKGEERREGGREGERKETKGEECEIN